MYRIVIIFVLTTTKRWSCLKEIIVKILILFLPVGLFSQDLSGLREKTVQAGSDTIRLDSMRIVPESIEIKSPEGEKIDDSFFTADPLNSMLLFNKDFPYYGREVYVSYRVFTSDPGLEMNRKDTSLIIPYQREEATGDMERYTYSPVSDDIWKEETLMRSGSISRGISFGNNQDVIVNSNLNLRLSGKLDDNLNITATISDQNIPLQPEGYSQQIHEFDRIFIELYNENLSLTAGDFEVKAGDGMFLPLDKKAQGVQFSTVTETGGPLNTISNTASAAVAKGRYHRNSIPGIEGNQGPYKLKGANNELFIIVLAGTERVFIDGRLLSRGVDRDYTIDYNLAEITFTSNMPVTKDRRIIVEFEYSDRNYVRFMLSNNTGVITDKGNYFINIFSEHDAKNQPLLQDLKEEEKELLSQTGDSLHRAWVPTTDSVEFRDDIVLYEKTDTVVDGINHTIYKYSADPEKASYSLSFSYVGENKGNYLPERNAANGRVFRWAAPVNGVLSGSHEPVMLLVTPKKQQVVSMGGSSSFSDKTEASYEFAISNSDKNTFSELDNEDNVGLAFRLGMDNTIPLGAFQMLAGGIDYEYSGKNFSTAERYRPVEYERDWNLEEIKETADEQRLAWYAAYNWRESDFVRYRGEYLSRTGTYSGLRNMLEAATGAAGFESRLMLSYLNSDSRISGTGFLRHTAEVSRPLWLLRLGLRSEGEDNRIRKQPGNLLPSSHAFHQWEIFLENPDTSNFHFFTAYREREDRHPSKTSDENIFHINGHDNPGEDAPVHQKNTETDNTRLLPSSHARELSAGFRSDVGQGNRLSGTIHHRSLKPVNSTIEKVRPENSLNGRLEARLNLLRGSITGSAFYETGSGMEVKKDFMYIEVAKGQGTHTWTDYNDNGIKELDEFEIAVFPDQANYIRVMIPSDDFIRTRANQFSNNIRVSAPNDWQNGNGLQKLLSLFTSRTAFKSGQKTSHPDLISGINPFSADLADTNLINITSSFRNTISFQTADKRFVAEYLHQNNKSRILMVNGLDTRFMRSDAIHGRWKASQSVTFSNRMEKGNKLFHSGFFPGRNFDIEILGGDLTVSFEPGYELRASVHLDWRRKINHPGKEKSEQKNLGTELNWSIPSKGNIMVRADYFYITYDGQSNTPLEWEMLEGLKRGNNMTLSVSVMQNLTGNLQLSLDYSGRAAKGYRFIHTGGMQMRAYF
ncbi:MAG: hypothetical protein R6U58_10080 [Bacteroidales bacterium]